MYLIRTLKDNEIRLFNKNDVKVIIRIQERCIVTHYTVNQYILCCNDCHEWLHISKGRTCIIIFKLDICYIQSIKFNICLNVCF